MSLLKKEFFSEQDRETLRKAISTAEDMTSGEIRLYVEEKCPADPYQRAVEVFEKLEMQKTVYRNGVLFYLAYGDKKFAVAGDEGIHAAVGQDFWNDVKEICTLHFQKDEYVNGLAKGITLAGEKLKQYFPHASDDSNELPDDIIENN